MTASIQEKISETARAYGGKIPKPGWIADRYHISIEEAQKELEEWKNGQLRKPEDRTVSVKRAGTTAKPRAQAAQAGQKELEFDKYQESKKANVFGGKSCADKQVKTHQIPSAIIKTIVGVVAVAATIRSGFALYSYFSGFDADFFAVLSAVVVAGLSLALPQAAIQLWKAQKVLSVLVLLIYVPVAVVSVLATNANLFDARSEVLVSQDTSSRLADEIKAHRSDIEADRTEKAQLMRLLPSEIGSKEYNRIRNNVATIQGRIDSAQAMIVEKQKRLDALPVTPREAGIGDNERIMNWSFAVVLEASGPLALMIGLFL